MNFLGFMSTAQPAPVSVPDELEREWPLPNYATKREMRTCDRCGVSYSLGKLEDGGDCEDHAIFGTIATTVQATTDKPTAHIGFTATEEE